MSLQRYEQVDRIFQSAVELAADQRAAFLDRACAGDAELRKEVETLLSYGLKPSINPDRDEQTILATEFAEILPREHLDFLQSLELTFNCGDFLFVHAGVRPGVPIHEQTEDDLLWIRDDFLNWEQPFERLVVHGHTPVSQPDLRPNRINIDTGAYATGRLTCVVIENTAVTQLSDEG